jgi:hypothetical protein
MVALVLAQVKKLLAVAVVLLLSAVVAQTMLEDLAATE